MNWESRIDTTARESRFSAIFDGLAKETVLRAFQAVEADEGTVWIADETHLCPVFNSGPNADRFLKEFKQPLDKGLISLVHHSGQVFCENDVSGSGGHDDSIDSALKVTTSAMIAVPLVYGHQPRGVISCVRLNHSGTFEGSHLQEVQHAAHVLERLLDWNLFQTLLEL